LRERLLERRYKAFRSRIVAPLVMQPMTAEETAAMIQFRLDGWGLDNPFSGSRRRHWRMFAGSTASCSTPPPNG
jgi:hypothetical protein